MTNCSLNIDVYPRRNKEKLAKCCNKNNRKGCVSFQLLDFSSNIVFGVFFAPKNETVQKSISR